MGRIKRRNTAPVVEYPPRFTRLALNDWAALVAEQRRRHPADSALTAARIVHYFACVARSTWAHNQGLTADDDASDDALGRIGSNDPPILALAAEIARAYGLAADDA